MGTGRILIVDDEPSICKVLCDFLEFRGYHTDRAHGGLQALERLNATRFDLIVSDVRMPGMSGIELLQRIKRESRDVGVVMLSACDDVKLAVNAMQTGALDYIVKPFHLEEVAATLAKALERQWENRAQAQHIRNLESALQNQTVALRRSLTDLREASEVTLEALVAALDAREHETQAHSKRVSEYAVYLANAMGIGGSEVDIIRRGSMLHDVGKIGISDTILLKQSGLTEAEWVEMRKHPQIGFWIIDGIEGLREASDIVLSHHERFDGAGYPRHLSAEAIPPGARVFSVVDSMDAITSDRPYRRGSSYERARDEIGRNAGSQFDPLVVDKFLKVEPGIWDEIRTRTLRETPRSAAASHIELKRLVFT